MRLSVMQAVGVGASRAAEAFTATVSQSSRISSSVAQKAAARVVQDVDSVKSASYLVKGIKAYTKRIAHNVDLARDYGKPTALETSNVLGIRTAAAAAGAQFGINELKSLPFVDRGVISTLESDLHKATSHFDQFQEELGGSTMESFVERHRESLQLPEVQNQRMNMLADSAQYIDAEEDMIWRLDLGTRYQATQVSLSPANKNRLEVIRAKVDQYLEQMETDDQVSRLSAQDLLSPSQSG